MLGLLGLASSLFTTIIGIVYASALSLSVDFFCISSCSQPHVALRPGTITQCSS